MPLTVQQQMIERRIARQEAKLAQLDERIGYLMSERVSMEDKLAELHRESISIFPLPDAARASIQEA